MRNLKKYPLTVLQVLNKYSNKSGKHFVRIKTDNNVLMRFEDADNTSNFFFEISSYQEVADDFVFTLKFRPINSSKTGIGNEQCTGRNIDNLFDAWVAILDKYERISNPFEIREPIDPIEQQYEDEYFDEFEIVDDDAETNSFSYAQQLRIDEYLERAFVQLEEAKDATNSEKIEEIKQDIIELKETQTQLTKKEVVRKLAKIWAKARKAGIKVAKKVVDEVIKEGVKLLVKGTLDGSIMDAANRMLS